MPSQKQLDHEEFCAKTLVSLCREHAKFERLGNDQTEPDIIFSGENGSLGIEVTSAFFRGDENDPNAHAREAFEFAENPTFDDQGRHEIWEGTNPYLRLEQSIKIQLEDSDQRRHKTYQLRPGNRSICIFSIFLCNNYKTLLARVAFVERNGSRFMDRNPPVKPEGTHRSASE